MCKIAIPETDAAQYWYCAFTFDTRLLVETNNVSSRIRIIIYNNLYAQLNVAGPAKNIH